MKTVRIVMAVLFSVTMCFAFGVSSSFASDSVKVGISLPVTGSLAKFGEIERDAFKMAQKEINAKGGINGKKLELIIEDNTGRPDVGRSVVEKLITKDKVVMMGGGYSSSVTYAVAGVCQQEQMPFLVNTGSADKITASGWKWIYRMNPSVSHYADAVKTLLSKVIKPKTAAILYENSLFGTKGAKSFGKICKSLGIKVVLKEGYEHGGIDYKPVLVKIKQLNPDIIYMVSYIMDASLLMQQSRELKLTPKMFIGGGAGFTLPEFKANAGVASDKVISATLWHQVLPFPGAMAFYKKFKAKYDKSVDYHGAEAYSACYVIADVLRRAKSFKNTDILESLSKTDMMTAFGPVKFTTWGKLKNQNIAASYVVQWIDGNLELVWPPKHATKKFVYPVNWLKTWGY